MSARLNIGFVLLAACLFFAANSARADDGTSPFSFQGYADFRLVAPPSEVAWLKGGLSKFRYGGDAAPRFAEAVGQGAYSFDDGLSAVAVLRAEPEQRTGLDALEAYLAWHPPAEDDFSWSVKTGAFFPTISLENDDLGWASPYTLTPSAINSWIGEELRTIGSEAIVKWNAGVAGTFSATGAITCCNDPAGELIADRGWAMDDRPTGLLERVRESDATMKLFHNPTPARAGLFEEIDGRPGWYAGLGWQWPGIVKLTALRYDNEGNPYAQTHRDQAWDTRFYAFGARTQHDNLALIAQGLQGQTVIGVKSGLSYTFFQSAFLLASYDLDDLNMADWNMEDWNMEDWRISARGEVFQTRHPGPTPSALSEDGDAATASLSWQHFDWLRLTGEVIAMHSRKGEYLLAGAPSASLDQTQFQLSARLFY